MGSGVSTGLQAAVKTASDGDLKAAFNGFSPDDRKRLLQALASEDQTAAPVDARPPKTILDEAVGKDTMSVTVEGKEVGNVIVKLMKESPNKAEMQAAACEKMIDFMGNAFYRDVFLKAGAVDAVLSALERLGQTDRNVAQKGCSVLYMFTDYRSEGAENALKVLMAENNVGLLKSIDASQPGLCGTYPDANPQSILDKVQKKQDTEQAVDKHQARLDAMKEKASSMKAAVAGSKNESWFGGANSDDDESSGVKNVALSLHAGGAAELHVNTEGDDGRSDACFFGSNTVLKGLWCCDENGTEEAGPYTVVFEKKNLSRTRTLSSSMSVQRGDTTLTISNAVDIPDLPHTVLDIKTE